MKSIVIINKSLDKNEFYALDENSGGYPYWSSSIRNAEILTLEQAEEILKSDFFTKDCKMSDGSINPPIMIHSALKLCNANTKAEGRIIIAEIGYKEILSKSIKGKL